MIDQHFSRKNEAGREVEEEGEGEATDADHARVTVRWAIALYYTQRVDGGLGLGLGLGLG